MATHGTARDPAMRSAARVRAAEGSAVHLQGPAEIGQGPIGVVALAVECMADGALKPHPRRLEHGRNRPGGEQ